jgi:hypothetical protein
MPSGGQGKLHDDLVLTSKVGVGDFRVRNLKARSALNVEGQFVFAEIGLAPVPSAQRVLLHIKGLAVPVFEYFVNLVHILRTVR